MSQPAYGGAFPGLTQLSRYLRHRVGPAATALGARTAAQAATKTRSDAARALRRLRSA